MSEPQVWTLISVFSATLIGMIALISQLFVRTMNTQFEALRGEIASFRAETGARFEAVDASFGAMDAKIGAMDAKFDAKLDTVSSRLDHIDRDVQAVSARVFPR
ncbi:hypothetical protein [Leucobacter ruminantium]|uniref:Uncharacterized protein n=1 Tax=Leucobacter ruminantium TaxID=1289170 RepID=A0A939LV34_9MICO|nr:hypothetical protein [Leucobacter ruminantium]MBO1805330.1 hypothetical protein [Leucobacter ruminantium]